jgi:environmental stress-induced protein Ves
MNRITLLRTGDYRRTRWKNDGGWTTEIARDPRDDDAAFRWRVSIADIESDGPFSSFPGIDRDLLLLAGNGIELDIDDGPTRRLAERFQRVHFAGESRVGCRLVAGATRDFNVMARRDAIRADVIARPLVGPMVIFGERSSEWLVHVFSGHAIARDGEAHHDAANGETLVIDFRDDASGRVVIDGGGELVMAKFVAAR